jgi:biofilm PGA synthesis lipoprotein PgaB
MPTQSVPRPVKLLLGALTVAFVLAVGSMADSEVPRGAVVILMYHHVGDEIQSPNVVPASTLQEHIEAILLSGLRIISLSELHSWLQQPDDNLAGVVLTFDDGYDSFYYEVLPLLRRYQVSASCFLIVSSTVIPLRGTTRGHITPEQARELGQERLVELGSHSYDGHRYVETAKGSRPVLVEPLIDEDHADFTGRVCSDLVLSKEILEGLTGQDCRFFSYPYGWVTSALRDQVSQCGFDLALTTRTGAVTALTDRFMLPRVTVRPDMTGSELVQVIEAEMSRALAGNKPDASQTKALQ